MADTQKRRIAVNVDLDGLIGRALVVSTITAALQLIRRDDGMMNCPGRIESTAERLYHWLQPRQRNAKENLEQLNAAFDGVFILSNRGTSMGKVTAEWLERKGIADLIHGVFLNDGSSTPADWKPSVVREQLEKGYTYVVHVDDNIGCAAAVAEVDHRRVLAYFAGRHNPSALIPHGFAARQGNMFPVANLGEAITHAARRLGVEPGLLRME